MTRLVGGAVLCTLVLGCGFVRVGRPSEPPPSLKDVRAYFAGLPAGYPVSAIERELHLPEPYESEYPAPDWPPYYRYSYLAHGLWVHFWADRAKVQTEAKEDAAARPLYFVGDWAVCSEEAYKDALRRVHADSRAA